MSDFKFIHCADLHLGSRFAGVRSKDKELAEKMVESTFESFSNIIDLAHSEKVDFIVISGDMFDSDTVTPRTRYRYAELLKEAEVPCYIVRGNHDFRTGWEDSIPLPPNAHEFGGEPETFIHNLNNGGQVELVGISFTSKHTKENLASKLTGSGNLFTIGCVHCDVDGGDDSDYAPCSLIDFTGKNVDYWALGHIHKRDILNERPYVVYPGNPQGRNIKESGEKGVYVVTVADNAVRNLKFVPTHAILWENKEINITGHNLNSFLDEVLSFTEKGSVIRLTITGKGPLNHMIRSEYDDIVKTIEHRTGSIVESMDIRSKPEKLPVSGGNDLLSKVMEVTESVETIDRNELTDMICSTGVSRNHLLSYFEKMSDDELKNLVTDAGTSLVERFSEVSE